MHMYTAFAPIFFYVRSRSVSYMFFMFLSYVLGPCLCPNFPCQACCEMCCRFHVDAFAVVDNLMSFIRNRAELF